MLGSITRRAACLALAVATLIAGCSTSQRFGGEPDLSEDAARIVRDYLARVSSETTDRGWSLLLPITRESTFANDETTYVDQAAHTDWSGFVWEVRIVERDEPYAYRVSIRLANGAQLSQLLAEVTYFEDDPDGAGPTFYVRFRPPFESGGIHHFGDRN